MIDFADQTDSLTNFSCADALALPFQPDYFDITFCHYFLLWLPGHALDTLHEMIRVTRPGGAVLAMAEPAYTKRIDYPQNLEPLGNLQTLALEKQGADPAMGLRLPELFSQAGLKEIRFGQSGFQNTVGEVPDWLDSEWDTFKDDLRELVPSSELNDLETLDRQAWANGSRILHIPTFYGIGIVKE
jgi:SAM-dependent methyltransferase